MAVAVKQKRIGRRLPSGPDWSMTGTGLGHEAETGAPNDSGTLPEGPETPLTKIGTRIALASLIFDGDWYQTEYPDVAAAGMDPVKHYFDDGSREGRNPNPYFDTNWYASNNPDVAAAGLNPFLHYLLYGAREGRKPAP